MSGYPGQYGHHGQQQYQQQGYGQQQYGYGAPPPGPPPGWGQQQGGYDAYGGQQGGFGGQYGGPPPPVPNDRPTGYAASNQHGYGAGPGNAPPQGMQHYGPQFQSQDGSGGAMQPQFQYSQMTGKRKALLIGVNYIGSSNALSGCIADAMALHKWLQQQGFREDDMILLRDDSSDPRLVPTRDNMLRAMQWLTAGAQPNDSLWFSYSGHGGTVPDTSGDEEDGMDECIYPVDFKQAGEIIDDDLFAILVRPLPPGCRLFAMLDACHSGSGLDLPYTYSTQGVVKEPNLAKEAGMGLLSAGMSYARGDLGGMISGVMGLGKKLMNQNSGARQQARQSNTTASDVMSLSGCRDNQTSADSTFSGNSAGACTYAFLNVMAQSQGRLSWLDLLRAVRDELQRGNYDQKPQLSASHPVDLSLQFSV